MTDATTLVRTVLGMRAMVPAKDFEISKQFYIELGFEPNNLTDRLLEMNLAHSPSFYRLTMSSS